MARRKKKQEAVPAFRSGIDMRSQQRRLQTTFISVRIGFGTSSKRIRQHITS